MTTDQLTRELLAALTPDTIRWVLHDLRHDPTPHSDELAKFGFRAAAQLDALVGNERKEFDFGAPRQKRARRQIGDPR